MGNMMQNSLTRTKSMISSFEVSLVMWGQRSRIMGCALCDSIYSPERTRQMLMPIVRTQRLPPNKIHGAYDDSLRPNRMAESKVNTSQRRTVVIPFRLPFHTRRQRCPETENLQTKEAAELLLCRHHLWYAVFL